MSAASGTVRPRLSASLSDRYRVDRELGAGGMATVYLAHDLKHDRDVAIKVLHEDLAATIGTERFLREIKIEARLTHPHILPMLDSGDADGLLFYVMPYVEGESLRSRMDREKQLAVDDALQISREVADALSYAHAHGVVHRDIKPENILLESGHAVVADFGIAHAIDHAGGEKLTATGIAMGTPAYMSPEQAAGSKDIDGRSDLYSLGCVLFEMLAGRPPFVGATSDNVVHQHLTTEPPNITAIRPAVPAQVAATLERALAKTPADRFNPVALFAEALGSRGVTMNGAPPPMRTTPVDRKRAWQRRVLLGVGTIVVVAGAVVAGRLMRPASTGPAAPPGASRTRIAVLPLQNLTTDTAHAYFAGGLHDEILTQLSKISSLMVISRTSVLGYVGRNTPLKQIANELGVGTVVEGTVQAVGGRLRVNVQLIDASTDAHLWAESYDRKLDDAFAIQSDIAQKIVAAVGARLSSGEQQTLAAPPTANAEAYRLYLQGEGYRQRPGAARQNLETAQPLYERALVLDPDFALAHASLSYVHGRLYWFRYDPRPRRAELQFREAETALRLAPDEPRAHWAMGMAYYWGRRDYLRALGELRIATEKLPGSAELWRYVGFANRRLGNWDQALAALDKATALNPRDADLFHDLGGNTYRMLHRYPEAVAAYSQALALAPDLGGADLLRALVYLTWQGRPDSLRAVLMRGPESYTSTGSAALWRARLALWERKADELLALLAAQPTRGIFEAQESYEPCLLYMGWAHQLRGDSTAADEAYRGALVLLDSALHDLPNDYRLHTARGLALAGLRRRADARREAEWLKASVEYRDAYNRANLIGQARAMIFANVGAVDEALGELEPLLSGPSWASTHTLRIDPRWDPIRDDPRFKALLIKYAEPRPVR